MKRPSGINNLSDFEGYIRKKDDGYTLYRPGITLRKIKDPEHIEVLKQYSDEEIEEHNIAYTNELKRIREIYLLEYKPNPNGYNEFGFNSSGKTKDGNEFNDKGYNSDGWKRCSLINYYTGTTVDLDGNPKPKNLEPLTTNEKIKTEKSLIEEEIARNKDLAERYANVDNKIENPITTEEFLRDYRGIITLRELISFAREQGMDPEIIKKLESKISIYSRYKKEFSKSDFLGKSINGIKITKEIIDEVSDYLERNNRDVRSKLIMERYLKKYVPGRFEESNSSSIIENITELEEEKVEELKRDINECIKNSYDSNNSEWYLPILYKYRISFNELIKFVFLRMGQKIKNKIESIEKSYKNFCIPFNKKDYLLSASNNKLMINGTKITKEIIERVENYLRENEIYICAITMSRYIKLHALGKLDLPSEVLPIADDIKESITEITQGQTGENVKALEGIIAEKINKDQNPKDKSPQTQKD